MPRRDKSNCARLVGMGLAGMGLAGMGLGGLLLASLLLVGGCARPAPVAGTIGQDDEIDRMFDGLIESLANDRTNDWMGHHPGADITIEMLLDMYNKSTAAREWRRLPDMLPGSHHPPSRALP